MLRTARFLHHFFRPRPGVCTEAETPVQAGDREVSATFYRRAGAGPLPGWVLLHGGTVTGRQHPSLVRFAHALAASGAAVVVPDIPDWRALRITSAPTAPTIRGAAEFLRARGERVQEGIGVIGFSFGATQALVAATRPEAASATRAVVGFGGYCDLRRTLRCMLTGEHEWQGNRYSLLPDPYGRWIIAANYLTRVPGCEGMGRVAEGVRTLAVEAGRRREDATGGAYDSLKREIRAGLAADEREVWDLLAPPAGALLPARSSAHRLADILTTAALTAEPDLDPEGAVASLRCPVVLAHGHGDRLIPFTETLRLRELLPEQTGVSATITRFFAHSASSSGLHPLAFATEAFRFWKLLDRALAR